MRARFRSFAAGLIFLGIGALAGAVAESGSGDAPAGPANKIWSGLVIATNEKDAHPAPAELRDFASRMQRVFGYNQFELESSAEKELGERGESTVDLGKGFRIELRARRALSKEARGGYLLNIRLFLRDRPLVDTEAKLAPGSPLFIRGPEYGKGHLIVVLQVQR